MNGRTLVVYVHGLWLSGAEAWLLRRRLARDLKAEERAFSYASVRGSATDNAAALADYLSRSRADVLHLVGHSLGGVMIVKMFENPPRLPPGRIVLLGPPLNGSRDLGVIAGNWPLGLGRLVGALDGPHDGAVTVAETRLTGATDHIVLPVSHSAMVLSSAVVRQTVGFLRDGRFTR